MFTDKEEALIEEGRLRWISAPKTELHVHLGGTVRMSTLVELAESKGQPRPCVDSRRSTLSECFEIFRAIHDAVSTSADIARVTRETVQDMAADGVKYLELRTTPRDLTDGVSAEDYVAVVVDSARRTIVENSLDIAVGVVVSIDRAKSIADAERNVRIASKYGKTTPKSLPFADVVGVELSGNPFAGNFTELRPALDYARDQAGMPVTIHMAEQYNPEETLAILDWNPKRVGHAVFLDDTIKKRMADMGVPVEVCLSSNMFSKSIKEPRMHPFVCTGSNGGHNPRCICTDDPGVFGTSLSREWAIAETLCDVKPDELISMSRESLEYSFAPEIVREHYRPIFAQYKTSVLTTAETTAVAN